MVQTNAPEEQNLQPLSPMLPLSVDLVASDVTLSENLSGLIERYAPTRLLHLAFIRNRLDRT